MKIVLLGGNSQTNIAWLEAMEVALKKKYSDVFAHQYLHWDTLDSLIDLDKELEILKKELGGIEQYVIVGKSAGALLALKGVHEHKLTPAACIFLGTAVLWGREKGFGVDSWLKGFSIPTLFIHKSGDPAIAPETLDLLLKESEFNNYKLQAIQGNEHEYLDYQALSHFIISFLRDKHLIN